MGHQRIIIIGGGIVRLGTAFKLGRKYSGTRITVLEKEAKVGRHQTGNNSGVLHCGLYYQPGSVKARMAVQGVQEIRVEDSEAGGADVRARAMSPDGTLVQDFSFVRGRKALHVLNAPSPAAAAALTIGEEIAGEIVDQL